MAVNFLLDTDTFSAMVSGHSASVNAKLEELAPGDAALSVVTLGEHRFGDHKQPITAIKRARANKLIDFFGVLSIDAAAAEVYGEIRAHLKKAGTPIGPNDLWLAAHALSLGATLVTNNTREFKRVKGLKLANWLA